jgi:putative ABC transport system permease protein
MALGARQRDVIGLMLWRGMAPVLAGLALGLAGALLLSRVLGSLLYQVSATDPLTFVVVVAVLTATSLVAAWLPARRAAAVDPTRALRYE